jgi:hypothetical protein
VGWFERMDERNQRRAEQDNVRLSNENYQRWIDEQPGPSWAYALSAVPLIGLIGDALIAVAGWRRQRRDRGS